MQLFEMQYLILLLKCTVQEILRILNSKKSFISSIKTSIQLTAITHAGTTTILIKLNFYRFKNNTQIRANEIR